MEIDRHIASIFVVATVISSLSGCMSENSEQVGESLYLINANVVDPRAEQVRVENLLISGGVIVGTPLSAPENFTGTTLDLAGKWVIPGLVDLHTHTFGNSVPTQPIPTDTPGPVGVLQRQLYAGVTAVLDLFGGQSEVQLHQTREQQRVGAFDGADLFASLSVITAPGGHGTNFGIPARTVGSPEAARAAVVDLAQSRPDVIKIIYGRAAGREPIEGSEAPSIDRDTLIEAVAAARELGLKTVVHVEIWQGVRDAIEAGANVVTHVPVEPIPEDIARMMVERNVASMPTLAMYRDYFAFALEPELLEEPMARALATPDVIADYRLDSTIEFFRERQAELEGDFRNVSASAKTLADAGVTMLLGTDSGMAGTLQGYSVHRELIAMVGAGLNEWQALAAATVNAGDFLERDFGVTPGSEANLVIIDASPIADIRNTQLISDVIHHGVIVDRSALLESESAGLRK